GQAAARALVEPRRSGTCWAPAREADGKPIKFSVRDALQLSGGNPISPIQDRSQLDKLARRLLELMDRAMDPVTPWMVTGHLGYMVAWQGAELSSKALDKALKPLSPQLLELCDVFANSVRTLKRTGGDLQAEGGEVSNEGFGKGLRQIVGYHAAIESYLGTASADGGSTWAKEKAINAFAKPIWQNNQDTSQQLSIPGVGGVGGRWLNQAKNEALGNFLAKVKVLEGDVGRWVTDSQGTLAACEAPPSATWTLDKHREDRLEASLEHNRALKTLFAMKVKVMADELPQKLPDWDTASRDYHGTDEPPGEGVVDLGLLGVLARIRVAFGFNEYRLGGSDAARHIDGLLEAHLRQIDKAWSSRSDHGDRIDWALVKSLLVLSANPAIDPRVQALAGQLGWQHLGSHEARMAREWDGYGKESDQTVAILTELNDHLSRLENLESANGEDNPIVLDDATHKQWLETLDTDLAARLQRHLDAQVDYWRPDTKNWKDLRLVIVGVRNALQKERIGDLVKQARARVDAPAADEPQLRSTQPCCKPGLLPNVAAALQALRGFTMPGAAELQRHPIAVDLGDKLDLVEEHLKSGNGKQLAAIALELAPVAAPATEPTTVDHYLRPLQAALATSLVDAARSRYVHKLADIVTAKGSPLLAGLYANTPSAINQVEDAEVIRRLGLLLDSGGELDVLRRDYRMLPSVEDPTAPHLHPGSDFTPPTGDAAWWQFEAFLALLQPFLLQATGNVTEAAFRVKFELPRRDVGVWNHDATRKPFCWYAASADGRGQNNYIVYDQKWGKLEKPLQWQFLGDRRPSLWFLWTQQSRLEVRGVADRKTGDLTFELTGNLAPLLWAWSGSLEAESGRWEVSCNPEGTTEKAALLMSFVASDGTIDLKLPPRPVRPTPF
ncbi:MAG: hypothetical protein KDC98_23735, partial [Planctomycetes bacterium]|nr:hypothetical protein [Planctomycetota bacterium]